MFIDGMCRTGDPKIAGAIASPTLKRGSSGTVRYTVSPPKECPDMPIRVSSIAPKNGDPESALAASSAFRTKRMSCGRSRNDALCADGVPQFGKSKTVFPGCGGAATTNPYDAIAGVRKRLWFEYPHEPC